MRSQTLPAATAPSPTATRPTGGTQLSVLLGCFLALLVSSGVIISLTFGTLLKPVSAELHLSRTQATSALLLALTGSALLAPLFGRLVDRHGVHRITVPAIAAFAVATACVGWLAASALGFILLYGLVGAVSSGHAPTAFAKVLIGWFHERRGLALGAAMSAVGVGGAAAPVVARLLIEQHGWRGAYVGLGVLIAVIAIPATLLLVREPARDPAPAAMAAERDTISGLAVWRDRDFCVMATIFALMGMAATGVMSHLVAMWTDRGMATGAAVQVASAAGLALIGGRLAAGVLLDWVGGRNVTLIFLGLMVVGIGMLLMPGTDHPVVPAVLVGLGLGAEVDLLGYLLSVRYGLRGFASRYGMLFGTFTISSGLGSLLMGATFDATGTYRVGLSLLLAALLAAMLCTLALPRLAASRAGADRAGG